MAAESSFLPPSKSGHATASGKPGAMSVGASGGTRWHDEGIRPSGQRVRPRGRAGRRFGLPRTRVVTPATRTRPARTPTSRSPRPRGTVPDQPAGDARPCALRRLPSAQLPVEQRSLVHPDSPGELPSRYAERAASGREAGGAPRRGAVWIGSQEADDRWVVHHPRLCSTRLPVDHRPLTDADLRCHFSLQETQLQPPLLEVFPNRPGSCGERPRFWRLPREF